MHHPVGLPQLLSKLDALLQSTMARAYCFSHLWTYPLHPSSLAFTPLSATLFQPFSEQPQCLLQVILPACMLPFPAAAHTMHTFVCKASAIYQINTCYILTRLCRIRLWHAGHKQRRCKCTTCRWSHMTICTKVHMCAERICSLIA